MTDEVKTADPELEAAIQRALALRCTMREICEAADVQETVLWRWRNGVKPNWERRAGTLSAIKNLIQERKDAYRKA